MKIILGKYHCITPRNVVGPLEPGTVVYLDEEGQVHRDDGPAVICQDGTEEWFKHGQLHRIGGPAVCRAGVYQEWYIENRLEREDGPAITCTNGETEYWYDNFRLISSQGALSGYTRPDNDHKLKAQELVIKFRPDLIGKIQHLHADLKAKYQHELELAGVDV